MGTPEDEVRGCSVKYHCTELVSITCLVIYFEKIAFNNALNVYAFNCVFVQSADMWVDMRPKKSVCFSALGMDTHSHT